MKNISIVSFILFGFVLVCTNGINAMSILDKGKACTFSKVTAVITLKGQPVENAKVIRLTNHNKKTNEEAYTDENGYVEFPSRFERSVLNILPREFAAGQAIDVYVDGKEYTIWSGIKRNTGENAEGNGAPIDLRCELTKKREFITVNRQTFYTQCDWKVERDEPEGIF